MRERELTRRAFLRDVARLGGAAAGLGVLAGCSPVPPLGAPPRVYRVGLLTPGELLGSGAQFWGRLAELGYVEGRNLIRIERGPTGDPALADGLVAELVRMPVDVIVARGNASIVPATAATTSIPIVLLGGTDPVAGGFVESLARPGRNVTGVTDAPPGVTDQKYMQLLLEAVPTISKILAIGPGGPPVTERLESAAQSLGVKLVQISGPPESLEASFRSAMSEGADGLLVRLGGVSLGNADLILGLAETHRLPGIYPNRQFVANGGLMTYATRTSELERRAADYVDRILRGAKPADLPVELPTRYDLIVNMRAARALGLTFPPAFLAQVDEVIE